MIRFVLIGIVTNALVLLALSYLLVDHFAVTGGVLGYLLCGFILGLINTLIRPLLKLFLTIVSAPFLFISGIIVYILMNAGVLWLLNAILANMEVDGVTILLHQGLWSYFVVALFFGVINAVLHFMFGMLK